MRTAWLFTLIFITWGCSPQFLSDGFSILLTGADQKEISFLNTNLEVSVDGQGGSSEVFFSNDGTLVGMVVQSSAWLNNSEDLVISREIGGQKKLTTITPPKPAHHVEFRDPVFTQDNLQVLVRADLHRDDVYDLYLISVDGNGYQQLSPIVSGGDGVREFQLTSNGQRIVYKSAQEQDRVLDLYAINLDGTNYVKLTQASTQDTFNVGADDFKIDPTDARVVYDFSPTNNDPYDLYSIGINGTGRVQLSDIIVNGDVFSFKISPNGQKVVYSADQDVAQQLELYARNIDASDAIQKVNIPVTLAGGDVGYFEILSDNFTVVYSGVLTSLTQILMVGDVNATSNVQVGDNLEGVVRVSPAEDRVAFERGPQGSETLHSIGLDGSNEIVYNDPAVDGNLVSFEFTPQGNRIVYRLLSGPSASNMLHSALTDADVKNALNVPVLFGGPEAFEISPDGSRVLIWGELETDGIDEVWVNTIDGGNLTKLSGPLTPGAPTSSYMAFNQTSNRAYFNTPQNGSVLREVYESDLTGVPAVQIQGAMNGLANMDMYQNAESHVVWLRNDPINSKSELFSINKIDGSIIRLNAPLVDGGNVINFKVSPDKKQVAYVSDQMVDETYELFIVSVDGSNALRLSGSSVAGANIFDYHFMEDNSRVIYHSSEDGTGNNLFSVLPNGSGRVQLNATLAPVASFKAGTEWVIFLTTNQLFFGAKPDGSEQNALTSEGSITDYKISENGYFCVYRSDRYTPGTMELTRVTADGLSALKANGATPNPGGHVEKFEISPDGTKLALIGDFVSDGDFQLLAGTTSGTVIVPLLPVETDFTIGSNAVHRHEMLYTADSQHLIFRREENISAEPGENHGDFRVYAFPVSNLMINEVHPSLPLGASVESVVLSEDSKTLVFALDPAGDNRFAVFATSLETYQTIQLNPPLEVGATVVPQLQIADVSQEVFFTMSTGHNTPYQLYLSSFDGTRFEPVHNLVNPEFFGVAHFDVSYDGQEVLYLSDEATGGALQLHVANRLID